jgi:hypothetical protein
LARAAPHTSRAAPTPRPRRSLGSRRTLRRRPTPVTKLSSTGTSPVSTFLGGTAADWAIDVAVNSAGEAYVVGFTDSISDFPLKNPIYSLPNNTDAYLAKLNSDLTSYAFTTYLGGRPDSDPQPYSASGDDLADAVALDGAGNPYVTGYTDNGSSFSPFLEQTNSHGGREAYVAKFKPDGTKVAYARMLGGGVNDYGYAIAVEPGGNAWVTGKTTSGDNTNTFPIAGNFYDDTFNGDPAFNAGDGDAFVSEFASEPATITDGPASVVKDGHVSFTFSSTNVNDTFKCKIGNAAAQPCPSPHSETLTDGTYQFSVQAYDAGPTEDGLPATRTFTVDGTPPSAFDLTSPADGATTAVKPAFSWQVPSDATPVSYQLFVDDKKLQDVDGAACSVTCSAEASTALGGGLHKWKVVAIDAAGNTTSSSSTRGLVVSAPPAASFNVAPNPALVGRVVSFDASGSTPGSDPIAKYEWDMDGDGSFETDTGGTPTAANSYPVAGTFNTGLRVTDRIGQTATAVQALRVSAPSDAGQQVGVSINKGAQYTNKPDVTLTVVAPTTATALLIANDGGFAKTFPQAVKKEVTWKLDSSGPERLPKTVYVRFLTGLFASSNYTDDIILDERPPVVDAAAVAGPPAASGASASKLRTWKVKVKAHDTNSGVGFVQVAISKKKPGKLLKYKKTVTVKLAARPKFLRARDRAGNFSKWKKLR